MIVLGLLMTSAFAYQPAGHGGSGWWPLYSITGDGTVDACLHCARTEDAGVGGAALKAHGINDGDRLPDGKLPLQWHLELSGSEYAISIALCNMAGVTHSQ